MHIKSKKDLFTNYFSKFNQSFNVLHHRKYNKENSYSIRKRNCFSIGDFIFYFRMRTYNTTQMRKKRKKIRPASIGIGIIIKEKIQSKERIKKNKVTLILR
jgi:ribosomal protein L37E